MKENLNKNIIIALLLEILALFAPGFLGINNVSYVILWLIVTILINSIAIFLLLKYKPKFYQLTAFICSLIFILPILLALFIMSNMGC